MRTPAASILTGLSAAVLEGGDIDLVYESLRAAAQDPAGCTETFARMQMGELAGGLVETALGDGPRAVQLLLFDVRDDEERSSAAVFSCVTSRVSASWTNSRRRCSARWATNYGRRSRPSRAMPPRSCRMTSPGRRATSGGSSRLSARSPTVWHNSSANLLDLSRTEAGLLSLHRAPCSLDALVDNAVRRLPPSSVTTTVKLPARLPLLDADAARLEVVLQNLLSNAQAYGSTDMKVSAEYRAGSVVVHVADDGPGIEADELPHIFERFYRAKRGSHLRAGGTGLGLAICKAFVEAHGGAIWAESSSRGTIITFTVPTVSLSLEATQDNDGSVSRTVRAS